MVNIIIVIIHHHYNHCHHHFKVERSSIFEMARNGGAGSQTHTCRSRTTSASSASRVHWTIDNRHVQNIYCRQYSHQYSPVYKDNPMKTRVHCSQTTDNHQYNHINNQAEDNQCKPNSPDNGHVQPTYHQHIIPNNQADDQKCKSRILDEYSSYSNIKTAPVQP